MVLDTVELIRFCNIVITLNKTLFCAFSSHDTVINSLREMMKSLYLLLIIDRLYLLT